MNADDSLLRFPCAFPIKIMGRRTDGFSASVVAIVTRHAPDFAAESVEMRVSAGGTYLSVTCTIRATSRAQLDALYRELTAHPDVRIVL